MPITQVQHNIPTNTIHVVGTDANDNRYSRNFSPLQRDEMRAMCGEAVEPYIILAGWTDEYLAARAAQEAALAAEAASMSNAEQKAKVLADFIALRDTAIARLNGIASQESRKVSPDQAVIPACDAAIEGLKAMSQHQTVVDAVGGEAAEDALQALYAGISAQLHAASLYAYTEFRRLDQ